MTSTLPRTDVPEQPEAPPTVHARRRGPGSGIPGRVLGTWIVLVVLVVGVLASVVVGLRAFAVESPSMGRAAPVGSLVVTLPLGADDPRAGEVITFVPPSATSGTAGERTYTHRVVAVDDGRITTRGDANAVPDAWSLGRADVVGHAVAVLPGAGWLLRTAPWLLAGTVTVWFLTAFLGRRDLRWALRLLGVAGVLAGVVAVYRPFVQVALLGAGGGDHPVARVVSTGMLPIRVHAQGGGSVRLESGQSGTVALPDGAAGAVHLAAQLDLSPVDWALFGAVCLLPVLPAVLAARRVPRRAER